MPRVEFIGLPGAGKSHVKDNLARVLKVQDSEKFITAEDAYLNIAREKIDRIYQVILKRLPHRLGLWFLHKLTNRSYMQFAAQNRFLAKRGKAFETFLSSPVFDRLTADDREVRIAVFMNACSYFESINDSVSDDQVILFDEGFIQKAFIFISHLIDCEVKESGLMDFLERVPISDVIIHVKTDVDTCCERMMSRQRGLIKILEGSDKKDVLHFLNVADTYMKSIVEWLKKRKDTIIIEIDNSDDLTKTVSELERIVKPVIQDSERIDSTSHVKEN